MIPRRRRLQEAYLDPEFWRAQAPALHVVDSPHWARGARRAAPAALLEDERFHQLGVSDGGAPLDDAARHPLQAAVAATLAEGLPALFALAYDEFWMLSRDLLPISRRLLGGPCLALPTSWIWQDPGAARSRRADRRRDVGARARIRGAGSGALSYLLPLSADCRQTGEVLLRAVRGSSEASAVRPDEPPSHPTRSGPALCALSLRAGLLTWDERRWHWDGQPHAAQQAGFLCLEIEHQRRDATPSVEPLYNPEILPSWDQRLRRIGQSLILLGSREHAARRLPELGTELIELSSRWVRA